MSTSVYLFLFSALLVVAVWGTDTPPMTTDAFSKTTYTASLSGEQVIPVPKAANGYGTSFCQLDRARNYLTCHVCQSFDSQQIIEAWIGLAPRSFNGPRVYNFSVALDTYFEQTFVLTGTDTYPVYSQVQDFLNGQWFIQITAEDGEALRGQLEQSDNIYALMASENTYPPAWGPPHRGITLGVFSYYNPQRIASYDIVHNVMDSTKAVIAEGWPNQGGTTSFVFPNHASPIIDEIQYTISEELHLLAGYQFSQVFNEQNPQGAIRGQLMMVDPVPYAALTTRMDSTQLNSVDSVARGCGIFTYDCTNRLFEYLVFHNVPEATAAQMRAAPRGYNGELLFSLSQAESPIFGSRTLSAVEEWILYAEEFYVLIESRNFPNGEIRGQVTTQFDFYAYLSGNQVVPPVTTAHLGCATFTLTELNYNIDFDIEHSVPDPISVDLMFGEFGQTGDIEERRQFQIFAWNSSPRSPVVGDMYMDDDEGIEWVQDRAYIQVTTPEYPNGIIRGQVLRLNPCQPDSNVEETYSQEVDGAPFSYIALPVTFNGSSRLSLDSLAWFLCALITVFAFI